MPFLNFLFTPIGKIVGIIGLVIFGAIAIWGGIAIHDNGVRNAALLQYNNTQLEQTLEAQKKINEQIRSINTIQSEILTALQNQNNAVEERVKKLDEIIDRATPQPVSPVLRDVIRELGGR